MSPDSERETGDKESWGYLSFRWSRYAPATKSLFNSRVDWGGSSDFKGGRPVTFEVS